MDRWIDTHQKGPRFEPRLSLVLVLKFPHSPQVHVGLGHVLQFRARIKDMRVRVNISIQVIHFLLLEITQG